MGSSRAWALLLFVAVLLGLGEQARADTIVGTKLDYDDFGHVENDGNRCAATATINSFKYLWTKYPDRYGNTRLLRGGAASGNDLEAARDALVDGWTNLDGTTRSGMGCGTDYKSFWETKVHWIEDWAPGTTTFDGMVSITGDDPTKWYGGSVLENAFPTWAFLWTELHHGEDVELTLYDDASKKWHAVTLTGLQFKDTDGDGVWDPGEQRGIFWLDPDKPDQFYNSTLQLYEGRLLLGYNTGGSSKTVSIRGAYSESPIPEPTTFALLGLGLFGVAFIRRRRSVAVDTV